MSRLTFFLRKPNPDPRIELALKGMRLELQSMTNKFTTIEKQLELIFEKIDPPHPRPHMITTDSTFRTP